MLGPFATASRRIAIHQVSLLSHAACASMPTTTTTTTRDRGDRYGPMIKDFSENSQDKRGYKATYTCPYNTYTYTH